MALFARVRNGVEIPELLSRARIVSPGISRRTTRNFVLLMKNRSQIDFETIAGDVTNDRRRRLTQPGGKFLERASVRNDIDCDRWDDRARQSATPDFAAAAANADLQRKPTQPGKDICGTRAQLIFRSLQ